MSRYYCSSFGASSVARSVIFSPYNVSTQLLCVVRCEIEIMGPDLKDFIIFLQTGGLQVGWDSVMRMSADKRELFLYEAFLYFNPLLLAVSSPPPYGVHICISLYVDAWVHPFVIHICCIIVFHVFFYISGFDGLAVGNQLMVFCSRWSQLCKNIWSWSKSSDS